MPYVFPTDYLIDGVAYGPFGPYTVVAPIRQVWLGANLSGGANDFDLRNITVGTGGFGSHDLWNPTFGASVVPPFDSLVGSPADMTCAGGIITVLNGGADVYGVKDLGSDQTDVWVQFDLRVRAVMLSQAFSCDYMDVADNTSAQIGGIFSNTDPGWGEDIAGGSSSFGTGPIADVWVTVGAHYGSGTPPPPAGAAVFDSQPFQAAT